MNKKKLTMTALQDESYGSPSSPAKDIPAYGTSAQKPSYPTYTESPTVTAAKKALAAQMAKKPVYTSRYQTQMDSLLGKIENPKPFSYDINNDALYEQYKNQYIRNGKLASADVMGQAQAMTGGYGNSYAQTVGNEAYLSYIADLNNIIPDLNQMAYDRHQAERQALLEQYALLAEREGIDYDRYMNDLSLYLDERNYLSSRLDAEQDFDYAKYLDDYGAYRDSVSDRKWQTEYDAATKDITGSDVALDGPSVNGAGNPVTAPAVQDGIIERIEGVTDNYELADILDGLTASGDITEEQADRLFAQYRQADKAGLADREWTLIDDGGVNGLGGIDNNAVVRDQYGNQYRLDKLVKALVSEGMDKEDAKKFVKDLQTRLGA